MQKSARVRGCSVCVCVSCQWALWATKHAIEEYHIARLKSHPTAPHGTTRHSRATIERLRGAGLRDDGLVAMGKAKWRTLLSDQTCE
jgi:hypothetical protein